MSSVIIEYRVPIVEHLLVMLIREYKIEFIKFNYIYYSLAFSLGINVFIPCQMCYFIVMVFVP